VVSLGVEDELPVAVELLFLLHPVAKSRATADAQYHNLVFIILSFRYYLVLLAKIDKS